MPRSEIRRRLNTVLQESEDALQQEFARVWAACKSAFGVSDHDVAARFMALWRQPNNINTVAGRSSVRRRNYLEDLKQSVIKGLRNKQGCNSIDIPGTFLNLSLTMFGDLRHVH